jgi:hypothetical protein
MHGEWAGVLMAAVGRPAGTGRAATPGPQRQRFFRNSVTNVRPRNQPAVRHGPAGGWAAVGRIAARGMRCTLRVLLTSITMASANASACGHGPLSIFHDDIPRKKEGSVIIEATIIAVANPIGSYYSGIAHIEKVIQGNVRGDTIRILSVAATCHDALSVGDHGIVIGNTKTGEDGVMELVAIPDFIWLERQRKWIDGKH